MNNLQIFENINTSCNLSAEFVSSSNITIDDTIDFVFNGLGIFIITLAGVFANIISVIVLSHRKLKSSLTTFLLGLTISDTVVISTSFLIFSLRGILKYLHIFSWYVDIGRPYLLPWLLPIALTAQMSSVYFTVVITVERYIAVCLPLHSRTLCTRNTAKWTSIAIVGCSILYNIPRWFEYTVIPKDANCTTGPYTETETELRMNRLFITYYIHWAYFVLMYLIPFTIMFFFNAAIYQQTKIHRTIRKALSPSMCQQKGLSEDIQLASMLFGIVITFISCNILAVVINIMENFGNNHLIGNLIPISNFLIVLCCSTNFIFYCVFGTEFRRRLRRTLKFSSSRKDSNTRTELWSDKDGNLPNRHSLQISSFMRSRSSSNSNCTSNNNGTGSAPLGNRADSNEDVAHCHFDSEDVRPSRQSTTTIITVVSDEL